MTCVFGKNKILFIIEKKIVLQLVYIRLFFE